MVTDTGGQTDATGAAVVSIPDGVHSILILAPYLSEGREASCGALLDASAPAATTYLSIAVNSTITDRIEHWRQHVDLGLPARFGVISGVELSRSTAARGGSLVGGHPTDLHTTTVDSPGDLTGIGMAVEKCLSEWGDADARMVVCLDSVGTLLQYSDMKRVFQFLHMLLTRIRAVDGTFHAHLDPAAYDAQTVNTLCGLFERTVDVTD